MPSTGAWHLHLLVDGTVPVRSAHAISHRVEEVIRKQFSDVVDVTIQVEPSEDAEEGL